MTHLCYVAKLLTEKHLALLLCFTVVGVSTTVHMSAAIFVRETQNNFPIADAVCAAVPTDLAPPVDEVKPAAPPVSAFYGHIVRDLP